LHALRDDLVLAALLAIRPRPAAPLQAAFHQRQAAFGALCPDEFCLTPAGDDVHETPVVFSRLPLTRADMDGETTSGHGGAMQGRPDVRVTGQIAQEVEAIQAGHGTLLSWAADL
jgi:hypothetical protein